MEDPALEVTGQAKQQVDQATLRVEQEKKEASKERDKRQCTTLREMLTDSHELQSATLRFASDIHLSQRRLPVPCAKFYPTRLEPWSEFGNEYLSLWDTVFDTPMAQAQLCIRRDHHETMCDPSPIETKARLDAELDNRIKGLAQRALLYLKSEPSICAKFNFANAIKIESALRHLSEDASAIVTSSPSEYLLKRTCVCVYDQEPPRKSDGSRQIRSRIRKLALIEEAALPQLLTSECLRVGLRSMNLDDEIVNRAKVDPDALFEYHAERASTAAVAHLYHYMIESGLSYGLLTTGQAMVFLHIDWQNPEILYFHLAEPNLDMQAHPDKPELYSYLGQYLAFSLTALGAPDRSHRRGQDERQRVMDGLKTWEHDYSTILLSNPLIDHVVPASMPPYKTKEPPSRQELDLALPSTSVKSPAKDWTARPYCTQKCLSGLVNGDPLYEACPNIAFHRKHDGQTHHPVDHTTWLELLGKQLKESLDVGISRVNQAGSCGVLFRITLIEYGYGFVSKGTVAAQYRKLQAEAKVYDRLKKYQGINVPVHLGYIDLRSLNRTYHDDYQVYIVHLMLLSFGGEMAKGAQPGQSIESPTHSQESLQRSLETLHRNGVVHNGVARRNVLVNAETGDVMLIDFEKSDLHEIPENHGETAPGYPKLPGISNDLYAAAYML